MSWLDRVLGIFGGDGAGDGGSGDGPPGGLTCEEALERLYEYLDGELADVETERVDEHLEVCRRCYPRLAFEESFRAAVERAREGKEAPPHVRNRILSVLREEGGSPGGSGG